MHKVMLAEEIPPQFGVEPPVPGAGGGLAGICSVLGWPWFKGGMLVVFDLLSVSAAHFAARALTARLLHIPKPDLAPPDYYLFFLPFFAASFYLLDGYKDQGLRRPEKELEFLFKAVSFFFLALISANFIVFRAAGFSRYLLVAWYALTLLALTVSRFSVRAFYNDLWRRGLARKKAIVAGPFDRHAAFHQQLAIQHYRGYELVGALVEQWPHPSPIRFGSELPILGALEDWEEIAERHGVQLMLLNMPHNSPAEDSQVIDLVRRCQWRGLQVEVHSDLFASTEFEYEHDEFSGFFRFYAAPRLSLALQMAVKEFLDRMIGLLGSLLFLLIAPFVALLIKLDDGGPVFYRSAYLGQDRRDHYYLKFRSMRVDADQILAADAELRQRFEAKFKLELDPRITRVGKFLRKSSLDEFPQFVSVLLGQLSYVGPRTIRRDEAERYGSRLSKLLSRKPGVTGFWQVTGRQNTTYEERVHMDMFYIDRWSIWMDLVIIAKTFWQVIKADGAY